jgi:hypothetical protein
MWRVELNKNCLTLGRNVSRNEWEDENVLQGQKCQAVYYGEWE